MSDRVYATLWEQIDNAIDSWLSDEKIEFSVVSADQAHRLTDAITKQVQRFIKMAIE